MRDFAYTEFHTEVIVMPNYATALFIKSPRVIEDLICPHLLEQEREYEVVQEIILPQIDYKNFITDMLADRQFLEDNAHLCGTFPSIRCLRIRSRTRRKGVLVVPQGAYVFLAARE